LARIGHPRLPPSFHLAAAAWARVDLFEYGCMIKPVTAFFHVGVENIAGFMAANRDNGFDRIVSGPPRSDSIAVGCKAGCPCGFEHTMGPCLEGSVVSGGHAPRPHVVGPRLWSPYPTNRGGLLTQSQGMRERQPLLGGQGLDPINACRLFPFMVLSDPAYGQELRRPGLHQPSLEWAYCATITTTGGSGEAFLQLEHLPLHCLPGHPVPSIHRGCCARVPSILASCHTSPFHVAVSPSAYPMAFPWACACETSPLPLRLRLTPAPLVQTCVPCRWRAGGGVTPFLGAVCRCA